MEIGLRLLMTDGAVRVVFQPRLSADQYADLVELIEQPSTKHELCEAITAWAYDQGVEVECEDA